MQLKGHISITRGYGLFIIWWIAAGTCFYFPGNFKKFDVTINITIRICYIPAVIKIITTKRNKNSGGIAIKIAVVCANGKAGKLIVKEAAARGLDITAVVREKNRTEAQNVLTKDLFDLMAADLKGFDVVIDAFGAWGADTLPQHSTSLQHLCNILSGTETRLLVVGGAGSLYVNPGHTACVADGPDFPDAFKPLAAAMAKALTELRRRQDVRWTYLSPAGDFQADGARTGSYILGGEELPLNSKGESVISYADYAIAMVDEATKGNHIRQRISVVAE